MRFRRKEQSEESCPRCGIPAPSGTHACSACGWDLHDVYHATFVGSRVGLTEQQSAREGADR